MPRRNGPVHVATTRRTYKGKVYETHLLRRTYREGAKVKHETLGNLSHLPPDLIDTIRRARWGGTAGGRRLGNRSVLAARARGGRLGRHAGCGAGRASLLAAVARTDDRDRDDRRADRRSTVQSGQAGEEPGPRSQSLG